MKTRDNEKTANPAQAHGGLDNRRQERRECLSVGVVKTDDGEMPCVVVNISEGGKGVILNAASRLELGQKVKIETPEIGSVVSTVRWETHPRYGLQITDQASALDKYKSYFASLDLNQLIAMRTKFIDLDADAQTRLRGMAPLIRRQMPLALDKFYARVMQTNGLKQMFGAPGILEHAKSAQIAHWEALTASGFDGAMLAKVRRIGETHARIGLEPDWYIGGYAIILEHLIDATLTERAPRSFGRRWSKDDIQDLSRTLGALTKAVLLDCGASVSVYQEAANEARIEAEAQTISRERTFVAESIGEGLAQLASRNLTYRMKAELPDIYRRVQANFNDALGQMDDTLKMAVDIVTTVRTGVAEISSAVNELSSRTEQQAAGLQQTASALNEITGAVASTAANVKQAQQAVATTHSALERSAEVVRQTVEAVQTIAGSSRQITHFVGVIDEIAFQTNLLALNAGVEAARAGEAGRGFAVVAAEVRALALRAAEAAKEIKALISTSTKHVDDGVRLVDATGATLTEIAGQVTAINGLMTEVASSAVSQSSGLHEINVAIGEMEKTTQQNAAMSEQASAVCGSVLDEAGKLSDLVAIFELSGGHRTAAPSHGGKRDARSAKLTRVA